MSGVYKQKGSKYYQIRIFHDGKLIKTVSSRTSNKKLALEQMKKLDEEYLRESKLDEGKATTLNDALDLYLRSKTDTRNYPNYATFVKYIKERYDTSMSLTDVSTATVNKWVLERKGKPATKKHFTNMIRGMLKVAKAHGYKTQVVDFPTHKVPRGKLRYLTTLEEKRLLKELQPTNKRFCKEQQDNYDFVLFLLDTGCRHGEACLIKWDDIDFNKKTVRLYRPKVGNESVLHLSERLHTNLYARFKRCPDSTYVFTAKDGGPRKHSTIAIRKAFKRAGIEDATVHTLRHTFATRMVQADLSLYEVSKLLGHSDIQTSQIYAHLEHTDVAVKAQKALNEMSDQQTNLKVVTQ